MGRNYFMKKRIELLKKIKDTPLHTRPIMSDDYLLGITTIEKLYYDLLSYTVNDSRIEAIATNVEENYLGETAYIATTAHENLEENLFYKVNDKEVHKVTVIAINSRHGDYSVTYIMEDDKIYVSDLKRVIIGKYEDVKKAVGLEYEILKESK